MNHKRSVVCCSVLAAVVLLAISLVAATDRGKAYGEPLTGTDTVLVSSLVDNADDYIGKTVRIQGVVTGVCEKRGCWMSLASDRDFEEVRVKVDDGVIVFPIEAKGRRAIAEGTFSKIELTMEQTLAYAKHHAEEHGEAYDPTQITEPRTYFQIKATGARIF